MSKEESSTTHAVSLKLPPFWSKDPRAWFIQAEAQFAVRRITTEETKYWYVVSSLDQDTVTRCISFLERPPVVDQYVRLKKFLLDAFDLSEDERGDLLLDIQNLGDQRPSELADRILQLNGCNPNHFLLRRIFIRALPLTLRNALSTSTILSLRELGIEADRVMSTIRLNSPSVNTAANEDDGVDVDNVSRRRLCFYHRQFGPRARRCVAPCDWRPAKSRDSGNDQRGPRH